MLYNAATLALPKQYIVHVANNYSIGEGVPNLFGRRQTIQSQSGWEEAASIRRELRAPRGSHLSYSVSAQLIAVPCVASPRAPAVWDCVVLLCVPCQGYSNLTSLLDYVLGGFVRKTR